MYDTFPVSGLLCCLLFLSAPSAFAACVYFFGLLVQLHTGRGALWILLLSLIVFLYPLSFVVVDRSNGLGILIGGGMEEWNR